MPGRTDDIEAFAHDVTSHHGYQYTTGDRLSARLANRTLTDCVLSLAEFGGKRVLDVGCGDGTYTGELSALGSTRVVHGVDPAEPAVRLAQANGAGAAGVVFAASSAYALPYRDDTFDVAVLRGVLHHMGRPVDALREALRVAATLVVIEPNGYNPALKLLERFSAYHVAHGEKSYRPALLDRWVGEVGGEVRERRWAGFVPMFCPDWMARLTKVVEPAVEAVPGARHLGCAVYTFRAERRSRG